MRKLLSSFIIFVLLLVLSVNLGFAAQCPWNSEHNNATYSCTSPYTDWGWSHGPFPNGAYCHAHTWKNYTGVSCPDAHGIFNRPKYDSRYSNHVETTYHSYSECYSYQFNGQGYWCPY